MSVCRAPVIAGTSLFGNDSYTKVMLHMEGANAGTSFIDTAYGQTAAHTWTANSATTSTTAVKFGSTSCACGAGSGYIDTPDSADYALGSGDFTVDCWFNRQGGDGTSRLFAGQANASGTAATSSFFMQFTTANVVAAGVSNGSGFTSVTGTTTFTATGWNHVAFVRTGNTLRLFVNGTQEGGDVAFASTVNDSANKLAVGRWGEQASSQWNGFLDEFRLSVGIARWTANFTAPTGPYG